MTRIYKKIPTTPEDLKQYTVNTWVYLKGFGIWKEDVIFNAHLFDILEIHVNRLRYEVYEESLPTAMLVGYKKNGIGDWLGCFLPKEILITVSLLNKLRVKNKMVGGNAYELKNIKPAINKYRMNYLRNLANERTIYRTDQ